MPFCWLISVAACSASVRRTYSTGRYFAITIYVCPTSSAVSLKAFQTHNIFSAYHSRAPSSNVIMWSPLCRRVTATAWRFVGNALLTAITIALLSLVFRSSVMPVACTVSCLICRAGMIFACIVDANAADCLPIDRLPFAAMLAQDRFGCSSIIISFIITLLKSFRLIQTITLLLSVSALDSSISAWFSASSFVASASARLTIVSAFFSCSLSSPPLSSLSLSSIALTSSLCLLMVSAVSRSRLARDSSSGRPCVGGGGLLWCRLCSNPRGSVSIELSSATDRRPFGVISPRRNRGRRFRFRGRFVFWVRCALNAGVFPVLRSFFFFGYKEDWVSGG